MKSEYQSFGVAAEIDGNINYTVPSYPAPAPAISSSLHFNGTYCICSLPVLLQQRHTHTPQLLQVSPSFFIAEQVTKIRKGRAQFLRMRECCSIQPRPHMHNSAKMDLDGDKEQLESENRELRAMCGYLSDGYYKNKKLGEEWRSFGKYTAEILKEELASSESERRVTKGELERLAKENKELKEMCLYLDQSRSGGEDNSLTPPEAMGLMLQGKVLEERSRLQGQVPRYSGLTKRSILQDSRAIRMGQLSERNKEMTLMEMKNRLDRVETERLELIKVLSSGATYCAAHVCVYVCVCACACMCVCSHYLQRTLSLSPTPETQQTRCHSHLTCNCSWTAYEEGRVMGGNKRVGLATPLLRTY